MAIILQDSFVGAAGDIDGRTPTVTSGSLTWVSDPSEPLNLNGTGAAVSASQATVDDRGIGDWGLGDVNNYGLPTGVKTTITFVIRINTSTTLGAMAYAGFLLAVEAGGTSFDCSLFGPNTTDGRPWQVNESDDGDSNAVITPAINTDYTGTYEIEDGAQTLTFMGNTKTSAVAFANPALGVNRISVFVGARFELLSILAEDDSAIPVTANLTAPMATVALRTGLRLPATAPMPTVRAVITNNPNRIEVAMPMPQASMRLGNRVAVAAPTPTVQMSGTTTGMIRVSATVPMPQVGMAVSGPGAISIQAQVPSPTVAMWGGMRTPVVAPMAQVAARVTTGSVIGITATVPMAQVAMAMSSAETISIEAFAPMPVAGPWGRIVAVAPMAQVTMVMRTVVAVTYEAYAVNLNHDPRPGVEPIDEVTRYTNYPFNQIVRYRDAYYGVASNGIYLLGGTTDYAVTPTAVPYAFKTALTDNKTPFKKRIAAARFAGRVGPEATITLYLSEPDANAYNYVTPRDADPQNYRQKFGRGAKARYFALGAAGDGELELDTLEPEIEELTRKI